MVLGTRPGFPTRVCVSNTHGGYKGGVGRGVLEGRWKAVGMGVGRPLEWGWKVARKGWKAHCAASNFDRRFDGGPSSTILILPASSKTCCARTNAFLDMPSLEGCSLKTFGA